MKKVIHEITSYKLPKTIDKQESDHKNIITQYPGEIKQESDHKNISEYPGEIKQESDYKNISTQYPGEIKQESDHKNISTQYSKKHSYSAQNFSIAKQYKKEAVNNDLKENRDSKFQGLKKIIESMKADMLDYKKNLEFQNFKKNIEYIKVETLNYQKIPEIQKLKESIESIRKKILNHKKNLGQEFRTLSQEVQGPKDKSYQQIEILHPKIQDLKEIIDSIKAEILSRKKNPKIQNLKKTVDTMTAETLELQSLKDSIYLKHKETQDLRKNLDLEFFKIDQELQTLSQEFQDPKEKFYQKIQGLSLQIQILKESIDFENTKIQEFMQTMEYINSEALSSIEDTKYQSIIIQNQRKTIELCTLTERMNLKNTEIQYPKATVDLGLKQLAKELQTLYVEVKNPQTPRQSPNFNHYKKCINTLEKLTYNNSKSTNDKHSNTLHIQNSVVIKQHINIMKRNVEYFEKHIKTIKKSDKGYKEFADKMLDFRLAINNYMIGCHYFFQKKYSTSRTLAEEVKSMELTDFTKHTDYEAPLAKPIVDIEKIKVSNMTFQKYIANLNELKFRDKYDDGSIIEYKGESIHKGYKIKNLENYKNFISYALYCFCNIQINELSKNANHLKEFQEKAINTYYQNFNGFTGEQLVNELNKLVSEMSNLNAYFINCNNSKMNKALLNLKAYNSLANALHLLSRNKIHIDALEKFYKQNPSYYTQNIKLKIFEVLKEYNDNIYSIKTILKENSNILHANFSTYLTKTYDLNMDDNFTKYELNDDLDSFDACQKDMYKKLIDATSSPTSSNFFAARYFTDFAFRIHEIKQNYALYIGKNIDNTINNGIHLIALAKNHQKLYSHLANQALLSNTTLSALDQEHIRNNNFAEYIQSKYDRFDRENFALSNQTNEPKKFTIGQTNKILSNSIMLFYQLNIFYHYLIFTFFAKMISSNVNTDDSNKDSQNLPFLRLRDKDSDFKINIDELHKVYELASQKISDISYIVENTESDVKVAEKKQLIDIIYQYMKDLDTTIAEVDKKNLTNFKDLPNDTKLYLKLQILSINNAKSIFMILLSSSQYYDIEHHINDDFNMIQSLCDYFIISQDLSNIKDIRGRSSGPQIYFLDLLEACNKITINESEKLFITLYNKGKILFYPHDTFKLVSKAKSSDMLSEQFSLVNETIKHENTVVQKVFDIVLPYFEKRILSIDFVEYAALQQDFIQHQILYFKKTIELLQKYANDSELLSTSCQEYIKIITNTIKELQKVSENLLSDDWIDRCKDYTVSTFKAHIYSYFAKKSQDQSFYDLNLKLNSKFKQLFGFVDEVKSYLRVSIVSLKNTLKSNLDNVKINDDTKQSDTEKTLKFTNQIKSIKKTLGYFNKVVQNVQNEKVKNLFQEYEDKIGMVNLVQLKELNCENNRDLSDIIKKLLNSKNYTDSSTYKYHYDFYAELVKLNCNNTASEFHKSLKSILANAFSSKIIYDSTKITKYLQESLKSSSLVKKVMEIYEQAILDHEKELKDIEDKLFDLIVDETSQQIAVISDDTNKLDINLLEETYNAYKNSHNKISKRFDNIKQCDAAITENNTSVEDLNKTLRIIKETKKEIDSALCQKIDLGYLKHPKDLENYLAKKRDLEVTKTKLEGYCKNYAELSSKLENSLNNLETKVNALEDQKITKIHDKFIKCYSQCVLSQKNIQYLDKIATKIFGNKTMLQNLEQAQNTDTDKNTKISEENIQKIENAYEEIKNQYHSLCQLLLNTDQNIRVKDLRDKEVFKKSLLSYNPQKDEAIIKFDQSTNNLLNQISKINTCKYYKNQPTIELYVYILGVYISQFSSKEKKMVTNTIKAGEKNIADIKKVIAHIDKKYEEMKQKCSNQTDTQKGDICKIQKQLNSSLKSYKKYCKKLNDVSLKIFNNINNKTKIEKVQKICEGVTMKDLCAIITPDEAFVQEKQNLKTLYETYKENVDNYIKHQNNELQNDHQDQNVNNYTDTLHNVIAQDNAKDNVIEQDNVEHNIIPHVSDIETDHNSNVMGSEYNVHHNE